MRKDTDCFLLHFSSERSKFWNEIYEGKFSNIFSKNQLLAIINLFLEKLDAQNKKIFCSFQESNIFFEQLQASIRSVENLDYAHELFLIQDIFTNHQDIQTLIYFDSIFPLWDVEITSKIFSNHNSYKADYSYGENLPSGISPPIFSASLIEVFQIEYEDVFRKRDFPIPLSTYIEKNINDFHVEIHYEEPDLRLLRLDFSAKTLRSLIKIDSLLPKLSLEKSPYQQLDTILKNSPEILRVAPSYLEIEPIQDCEYKCTFCPRQYLELPVIIMNETLLTKITDYLNHSLGDTSVCLGGLGEPLQHPKINEIIQRFLNHEYLHLLIVETNGYYLDKVFSITKNPNFQKLRWVINLNSLKNYSEIHGVEAYYGGKAKKNIEQFMEEIKRQNPNYLDQIYIQMLKINENEEEIDDIDHFAKELGVNFLLQKYNSYISLMPEKRVSDMTPLERFPCLHLRRDMSIRANGDVLFCKQGVHGNHISGNLHESSLHEIWNEQKKNWVEHFQKNYTKTPDCHSCDEYFTFNL